MKNIVKKCLVIAVALCILTAQAVLTVSAISSQENEVILCSDFEKEHVKI